MGYGILPPARRGAARRRHATVSRRRRRALLRQRERTFAHARTQPRTRARSHVVWSYVRVSAASR
eukprot:6182661-Pleurochrysis_carterae.AAC.2